MGRKIIYAAIFALLNAVCLFAQTPPTSMTTRTVQATPVSLDAILAEAGKQTVNYREEFNNLLAVETKSFEKYDKNGELKEKTVVESNFFVYQSPKANGAAAELRNVVKIDEKPVPESQERANRFLGELQKTTTVEKELEKIRDEGLRFDKSYRLSGLTLYEGIVLEENMRPFFDFNLTGSEDYQGNEVFVVAYRQTKKSPFITVNEKTFAGKGVSADFDVSVPGSLKKTDKFLRGKLWIDAKTFQIRREERQLVVQTSNPIVALDTTFEYQASDFGILVPKRITFVENAVRKTSKADDFAAQKNLQISFDYSKFKKSETDIKVLDDEN